MKTINKLLFIILLALIVTIVLSQTNSDVDHQHECILGQSFVYQIDVQYERPQDDTNQQLDFIVKYYIYPFNGFIQYNGEYYCSTNPNYNFKVGTLYYTHNTSSTIKLREQ